jgi:hypothetical protein
MYKLKSIFENDQNLIELFKNESTYTCFNSFIDSPNISPRLQMWRQLIR